MRLVACPYGGPEPLYLTVLEIPMPIYDYHCAKCGKDFEITEPMKDHGTKKHRCPACRSPRVERLLKPVFAKTSRKS